MRKLIILILLFGAFLSLSSCQPKSEKDVLSEKIAAILSDEYGFDCAFKVCVKVLNTYETEVVEKIEYYQKDYKFEYYSIYQDYQDSQYVIMHQKTQMYLEDAKITLNWNTIDIELGDAYYYAYYYATDTYRCKTTINGEESDSCDFSQSIKNTLYAWYEEILSYLEDAQVDELAFYNLEK